MKKELREKILAYNRTVKARADKAADLDMLVSEILKLPGQLKKLLPPKVVAVLEKYGYQ